MCCGLAAINEISEPSDVVLCVVLRFFTDRKMPFLLQPAAGTLEAHPKRLASSSYNLHSLFWSLIMPAPPLRAEQRIGKVRRCKLLTETTFQSASLDGDKMAVAIAMHIIHLYR